VGGRAGGGTTEREGGVREEGAVRRISREGPFEGVGEKELRMGLRRPRE